MASKCQNGSIQSTCSYDRHYRLTSVIKSNAERQTKFFGCGFVMTLFQPETVLFAVEFVRQEALALPMDIKKPRRPKWTPWHNILNS